MRIKIYLFLLFMSLSKHEANAQSDTTQTHLPLIELSGFVDAFYVFDFNRPETEYRQAFLYNHNRHNETNINLGLIKISAQHHKYRANIALQAGTYSNDNYANEPGVLKNIFEASSGMSINKKKSLWIDAGIFASHIGFESAISIDNWTLTRSLLAENSPYYLSGVKLSYSPNRKVELLVLACNGWQRIQRIKGNSLPSFGTQLKLIPTQNITLNWSTFIGTDDPDTKRRMRYFNNFYGQFQFKEKFGLIAGLDVGAQQRAKSSDTYDLWISPVCIAQFVLHKYWRAAIRAEYYQDETGIIIPTGTENGFKTTGISLNFDYAPTQNSMCRLEGRWLKSKDNIFESSSLPTNSNFIISISTAIKFSGSVK